MTDEKSTFLGRREFLGTLGATVAATGGLAVATQAAGENAAAATAPKIIDFHNHYVGPTFPLTTLANAPPALQSFWEGVSRRCWRAAMRSSCSVLRETPGKTAGAQR
jgi:hypothetical protein